MNFVPGVENLACVRVKGVGSEWFKSDIGVRQGRIKFPCLFNIYINAEMRDENGDGKEGSEIPE